MSEAATEPFNQLTALMEARLAVQSKMLGADAEPAKTHWLYVRTALEGLIAEVERAVADPEEAINQAEQVMHTNGRYPTFWISREWVSDYLSMFEIESPADDMIDGAIAAILEAPCIGSSEAAGDVLDVWMQTNWKA